MTFAVVFPGQGSQSAGMLAELAEQYDEVESTFAEASELLGHDLWRLSQDGPAKVLDDTVITQPLMFTAGVAVWRVLQAQGLGKPVAFAGHSLGEFAAMVASASISFRDGVSLVQKRASLMAAAVPEGEGGMAALLGMEDQAAVDLCKSLTGDRIIEAVNFNSPGQVVISGHLDALEKTLEVAREHGCRRAMMLPVSVPNHSSLMQGAGHELARVMETLSISMPEVPLVQNATAMAAADLPTFMSRLKAHVHSPVYWTRTIETLRDTHGATLIIEAGPGKVLAGLAKRIDRNLPVMPVDSPETLAAAIEAAQALEEEEHA